MKGFLVIFLCRFICRLENPERSHCVAVAPLLGPHAVSSSSLLSGSGYQEAPELGAFPGLCCPQERMWDPIPAVGASTAGLQSWRHR